MSLSVIEPTGVNLLRRAGDFALYEQIVTFRDAYFLAFESDDKEAVRHVIDLHDGDGSFDALPSRVRDYVVATTSTNILDWRSNLGFDRFVRPLEQQHAEPAGGLTPDPSPSRCGARYFYREGELTHSWQRKRDLPSEHRAHLNWLG
jgi:hypothetical protein